LTQFNYHKQKAKEIGQTINPWNFSNLTSMIQANKEHDFCIAQLHKYLNKFGIHKKDIREISSRHEGYCLLKPDGDACEVNAKSSTSCDLDGSFKPDLIISVGGDGTFLRASHLIYEGLGIGQVPILGINSNPNLSEGRLLCSNSSENIKVKDILYSTLVSNEYSIQKRNRIKINLKTRNEIDLDKIRDFHHSGVSLDVPDTGRRKLRTSVDDPEEYYTKELPILALNDVFIGERAASMVTDLEIWYKMCDQQKQSPLLHHKKQKHSGLIVCSGTGSTGWTKSANHICPETLKTVLENLDDSSKYNTQLNHDEIQLLTDKINSKRTVFDPSDKCLGLTFREPITSKISAGNDSNFLKVERVLAKSKLKYGILSIDGSTYYDFTRGSIVECEIDDKHALRCVMV